MRIKIRNLLLGAAVIAMSHLAYAVDPGFYIGSDFGVSNLNNKSQTILTDPFGDNTTVQASNKGIGIRLFMGGEFNQYGGVEGGFSHYASSTYGSVPYTGYMLNTLGQLVQTTSVITKPTIKEYGFDLEGKLKYPIGKFGVFGKLGFAYIRKTASGILATCSGTATIPTPCSTTAPVTNSEQSNAFRPLVALGASYDLSQTWVMDASATRITKGSGIQNLTFFSLGFSYHFVDTYCGQFIC
jgi:opacity protein-like surface antigen